MDFKLCGPLQCPASFRPLEPYDGPVTNTAADAMPAARWSLPGAVCRAADQCSLDPEPQAGTAAVLVSWQ